MHVSIVMFACMQRYFIHFLCIRTLCMCVLCSAGKFIIRFFTCCFFVVLFCWQCTSNAYTCVCVCVCRVYMCIFVLSVLKSVPTTEPLYRKALIPCEEDEEAIAQQRAQLKLEAESLDATGQNNQERNEEQSADGEKTEVDDSQQDEEAMLEEVNPYLQPSKKRPRLTAVLSHSKQQIRLM